MLITILMLIFFKSFVIHVILANLVPESDVPIDRKNLEKSLFSEAVAWRGTAKFHKIHRKTPMPETF